MSTHKKIDVICMTAAVFAVAVTVLLMSGAAKAAIPVVNAESGNAYFTANDLNADWDTGSATKIALSDESSTIAGNGAYIYDSSVRIAYAGHYVLTGELTNGSVVIDADKSDDIWLLLDGVTLYCDNDAAIRVEQADHVFLTLAAGTENSVSSGAQYSEEIIASGVDGAIYSRDDLTINGSGALTVDAEYQHGIVCNDDLAIAGGRITVSAVQDGIHANDSVRVRDAEISVSAGDDGITVSNDDETAFFYLESGSISIPACYEGIEAIDITIAGGTVDIVPTDDGLNANGSGEKSNIRVTGGKITVMNASGRDADGFDSNGNIYIEGGLVLISVVGSGGNCALDYGSENGGECVVSGGTVIACGGSMMAEGFDSDSPQGFLMYTTSAEAGTSIKLEDSAGGELLSAKIPYAFSSAVLSAPGMQVGDVCTVTVGDTTEEVTIENTAGEGTGFGMGGMFGGGGMGGRNRFSAADDTARPAEMPDRESMEKNGMDDALPAMGQIEPPEDAASTEERGMFAPDAERGQGDDARFRQQDFEQKGFGRGQMTEQMRGGAQTASAEISAENWILLGVSVMVLLIGLLFAVRIRH
ncbi:MAG: carbohydrate-binding domain-containing protein [Clostridium sp.]|nr:carbohydrate-binding domain-containing protein [Clostridium sp.]